MLKVVGYVIGRDLTLYYRRQSDWSTPLVFFIMMVSVFPMALAPSAQTLALIAPGIIWVAVVLSLLMSLDNVFRLDHQEGILEQVILSRYPVALILLGKSIAHFLAMGLPLLFLAPGSALLLHMSWEQVGALWVSLWLGIPIISLVGSVGSILTVGLHRGGVLLSILILPLVIPVILFGVSSVLSVSQGLSASPQWLILVALLLLTLCVTPLVSSFALKVSIE